MKKAFFTLAMIVQLTPFVSYGAELFCSASHGEGNALYLDGQYVTNFQNSSRCYDAVELLRSGKVKGFCSCDRNAELRCGSNYVKAYYSNTAACYDVAEGLNSAMKNR